LKSKTSEEMQLKFYEVIALPSLLYG